MVRPAWFIYGSGPGPLGLMVRPSVTELLLSSFTTNFRVQGGFSVAAAPTHQDPIWPGSEQLWVLSACWRLAKACWEFPVMSLPVSERGVTRCSSALCRRGRDLHHMTRYRWFFLAEPALRCDWRVLPSFPQPLDGSRYRFLLWLAAVRLRKHAVIDRRCDGGSLSLYVLLLTKLSNMKQRRFGLKFAVFVHWFHWFTSWWTLLTCVYV